MRVRAIAAAWLMLTLTLPGAAAGFGPTSEDGWPIGADGEERTPPVEAVPRPADGDPLNKVGPATVFPYYPLLTAELERLAAENPGLVKLTSAGESHAGLDLWMLEIANFDDVNQGNGTPLGERETLYIDGGTHSNEYSAVYFVTEIAQFLLDEYDTNETAQWIVDNRHTFLIPLVNPDGSNAFGRLNAEAVNVNRNFPAIWGEVDESPVVNNPGPYPASEPETQTVLEVLEEIEPDYVNSIHCCGNLWLHPYGHEDWQAEPDDLQTFTEICEEVFYDVREDCGPIWSTIDPASGTTADTGYHLHGASSWTYEMSGRGAIAPWGQPVVTEDVREQERESWRGVMHAFENVETYGAHPVLAGLAGTGDTLRATVENTGYQPLRNGTLTVDGHETELPHIGAGNTTTVDVEGSFEAGETETAIHYQKRSRHSPTGVNEQTVDLEPREESLVAGLDGSNATTADDLTAASTGDEANGVPAPSLATIVLGLLAALALARKRSRS
jgi:hypothetical protein